MNKEIELLNSDKVTLDYALLVLSKVFGFDKKTASNVATQVDRYGSAVVFTGSEEDAQEKMQQLDAYNIATNNDLQAKLQDAGTHQNPAQKITLSNHAVTFQLNSFLFPKGYFKFVVKSLVSLDKGLRDTINWGWFVSDLQQGKEVVIKEFDGDRAQQKADVFVEALKHVWEMDKPESEMSEEEKQDNANVLISVRAPGYTLNGPKSLISVEEVEKREMRSGLAEIATLIYDSFMRKVTRDYGSLEAYLEQASPEDIQTYQDLQEQMKEVEELKKITPSLTSSSTEEEAVEPSMQRSKRP